MRLNGAVLLPKRLSPTSRPIPSCNTQTFSPRATKSDREKGLKNATRLHAKHHWSPPSPSPRTRVCAAVAHTLHQKKSDSSRPPPTYALARLSIPTVDTRVLCARVSLSLSLCMCVCVCVAPTPYSLAGLDWTGLDGLDASSRSVSRTGTRLEPFGCTKTYNMKRNRGPKTKDRPPPLYASLRS